MGRQVDRKIKIKNIIDKSIIYTNEEVHAICHKRKCCLQLFLNNICTFVCNYFVDNVSFVTYRVSFKLYRSNRSKFVDSF